MQGLVLLEDRGEKTYHRSTLTSPRPSFVLSVPAAM
jgi:hypothetical protein